MNNFLFCLGDIGDRICQCFGRKNAEQREREEKERQQREAQLAQQNKTMMSRVFKTLMEPPETMKDEIVKQRRKIPFDYLKVEFGNYCDLFEQVLEWY